MKLTTTAIRSLTLPPGKNDKTFFDADLPGFGLRLRAGGSRTWLVQYAVRGKTRRMVLGSPAALDPGKARAMAKDLLAAVRLGRDPASERLEARARILETLGSLLPRYLARQKARLKPRSYKENERHLLIHAKSLHAHSVSAIDRRMVAILIGKVAEASGPTAANRVRASLSAFFAWAMREGLIENNCVVNTNKAAEAGPRVRVLEDSELARIWQAAGNNQFGAVIRLLMLTGARRDEVASLRWSEVNLKDALISLPAARTKSGRAHEIPLTPPALEILRAQPRRERELVFGTGEGGFQLNDASKRRLDVRIAASGKPLAHWVLHDFRRTMSTRLHETLGIAPHVVEALLGHVSGHRAGVAGVYNRSLYRVEKRRALEIWADHLIGVVSGRKSKIVAFRLSKP